MKGYINYLKKPRLQCDSDVLGRVKNIIFSEFMTIEQRISLTQDIYKDKDHISQAVNNGEVISLVDLSRYVRNILIETDTEIPVKSLENALVDITADELCHFIFPTIISIFESKSIVSDKNQDKIIIHNMLSLINIVGKKATSANSVFSCIILLALVGKKFKVNTLDAFEEFMNIVMENNPAYIYDFINPLNTMEYSTRTDNGTNGSSSAVVDYLLGISTNKRFYSKFITKFLLDSKHDDDFILLNSRNVNTFQIMFMGIEKTDIKNFMFLLFKSTKLSSGNKRNNKSMFTDMLKQLPDEDEKKAKSLKIMALLNI